MLVCEAAFRLRTTSTSTIEKGLLIILFFSLCSYSLVPIPLSFYRPPGLTRMADQDDEIWVQFSEI